MIIWNLEFYYSFKMKLLFGLVFALMFAGNAWALCNESTPSRVVTATNTTCALCVDIATVIDQNLHQANTTITVLEHIVEDLCELIGGKVILQECCLVLDGIQGLVNWLTKGVDPLVACQKMHFC